jgi:hypothetical protein
MATVRRDRNADNSTSDGNLPKRLQSRIEAQHAAVAEHRDTDISAVGPDQFTKSDKTAVFDNAIAILIHQTQVAGFCTDQQCASFVGKINCDHTVRKEIFKDFRRPGTVAVVKQW